MISALMWHKWAGQASETAPLSPFGAIIGDLWVGILQIGREPV